MPDYVNIIYEVVPELTEIAEENAVVQSYSTTDQPIRDLIAQHDQAPEAHGAQFAAVLAAAAEDATSKAGAAQEVAIAAAAEDASAKASAAQEAAIATAAEDATTKAGAAQEAAVAAAAEDASAKASAAVSAHDEAADPHPGKFVPAGADSIFKGEWNPDRSTMYNLGEVVVHQYPPDVGGWDFYRCDEAGIEPGIDYEPGVYSGWLKIGSFVASNDSRLTDARTPTSTGLSSVVHAAPAKTSPVDADEVLLVDSEASYGLKKVAKSALGAPLSSSTPQNLGTANAGNGTSSARDNHVHNMPTAADVGAVPTTRQVNGHALSADVTLPTSFVQAVCTASTFEWPNANWTNYSQIGDFVTTERAVRYRMDSAREEPILLPAIFTIPAGTTGLRTTITYKPEATCDGTKVAWKLRYVKMTDNAAWGSEVEVSLGYDTLPGSGTAPQVFAVEVTLATASLAVGDKVQVWLARDATSGNDTFASDVGFTSAKIEAY